MITQEIKLLKMLSNNNVTFFIPPYQRNYEWMDEQCSVFLDDIIKTYERNNDGKVSEHFFGTITYYQTEVAFGQPSKLILNDGQQRITTTMLFLVALRDVMKDNGLGNFIDKNYLKNENVDGDSEYKIKLKQVETDWPAFMHIILGKELDDRMKDSVVYRNYRYFLNKLTDYQKKGYDIKGFVEKGLDKFSVITIELQPEKNEWENPQEIFESMNSLGKPLSLADLVRNYLLLGLDADTQCYLYDQYWLHIEKVLPGQVSNFIRDYMQAKEQRSFKKATETNYKELYGLFKKIFAGEKAEDILNELSSSATVYSYLLSENSSGCNGIDEQLKVLNILNVTTAYSFLLELLKAWKRGELTDIDTTIILEAFKVYCLRRRLMGLTPGENKAFPTLTSKIPELVNAADKKGKMFDILANQDSAMRLPNDVELTRYLETMDFYSFRYCKYYLSLIEKQLTKSLPDQDDPNLQIEHIMPRTLTDTWKAELGYSAEEKHQELLHTIGNLTLIRHNQKLSNKPFAEKKVIYENNAGLQIARTEITNHQKWGAEDIRKRAEWIIKYLLDDVLAIPDDMRKTNNYKAKEGRYLSFQNLQLIGLDIEYIDDNSIIAHVIGDKEVEFEGKKWKLSPLTAEIKKRRGELNQSGAYQGAFYWEFDGLRLADIM